MEKILKEVLRDTKPTEREREKLSEIAEDLVERAEKVGSSLNVSIEAKLVGSAPRNTWISGNQDIDLFLLFPADTPREELEENGLKIGKRISEGDYREQYAEHPYINTEIDGLNVDIVPCYDIEDPSNLKSSVDRSPHHQEYIEERLTPELSEQVILLKKFLEGIGAYGSELRINGFSGYLCELLILRYESFENLIKSASEWDSPHVIAPGDERSEDELKRVFPNQPLIYIDPVDHGRNVAAAVSKRNFAKFVRASQDFIRNPSKKFFFPNNPPSSKEKLQKIIKNRKTTLFMITFDIAFDLVPDIVYPQLRKTEKKLVDRLEEENFKTLRSDTLSEGDKAAILVELEVSELPPVRKHLGPPLEVDSEPFIQAHKDSEKKQAGPYINEDGRLVFELKREKTKGKEILKDALGSKKALGKHIAKSIDENGYEIVEGKETVETADELKALDFLGDYLTKCLPWYR